ncbi:MAG: hypothetical protein RLZZ32_1500, partial [Cyanobacteriota bacterium]
LSWEDGMRHKNYRYGDYEHQLWDFRESEFLDDPDDDIDESLRSKGVEAATRQEDYSDYLGSTYWANVRATVLHRAGYKCERCGQDSALQVHHKSYCARHTELENLHLLEVLCRACHNQEHI